ncbi:sulfite efflux pump SSU1-like protein [Phanerochaete sordida]|uniref:Sulfite efflux pump SSU1-like protein n=1 Tax=Phanerochaete sordida TaxID=48140 RepID=A0A9P3GEH2_9APHY|nr:sulfite efflux pump SSU1-like protein [Phanerochaete sordida]
MADVHPVKPAGSDLPTHVQPPAASPPPHQLRYISWLRRHVKWVPWRTRIKNYSWQWHGLVTATAVVSSVMHIFPYHNSANALKVLACILLIIALIAFVFNVAAKIAKVIMYPKDALTHITDPAKSSFAGFLAVGGAGLIDAAVNVIRDWHPGAKNRFLFAMYGLWYLDAAVAWFTAFGVIYFIIGQKTKDMGKIMAIWIIPCVSMIASSTCGGLLAGTLYPEFPRLALITTTFAITMGLMGLCFTTMITFGFLMRLFLHGAPDGLIALATWNILTPLGQGGFSLLINGQNLSLLVPYMSGSDFPEIAIAGKLLFSVCFCGAYLCWCMGFCWIMLSLFVLIRRARKLPNFGLAWWGAVFPNGTYALLTVQLGNVLKSRFYHGFGAAWSIIVMLLWTALMLRTIPAFVTGTMFLPHKYYLDHRRTKRHHRHHRDAEKGALHEHTHVSQPEPAHAPREHSPERDDRSTLVARGSAMRLTHSSSSQVGKSASPHDSGRATPVDGLAHAVEISGPVA